MTIQNIDIQVVNEIEKIQQSLNDIKETVNKLEKDLISHVQDINNRLDQIEFDME